MGTQKPILAFEDVKLLVDNFYDRVQNDDLLSPIFERVVKGNWQPHLDKMYRFWQTILLNEHTYSGSPFAAHTPLPIEKQHFNRWLELFHQTIDENFTGEKAEEAKWRADSMGQIFHHKLKFLKGNRLVDKQ